MCYRVHSTFSVQVHQVLFSLPQSLCCVPLSVKVCSAGTAVRSGQACVLYFHQRGGDFFVQNSPILPTISLTACRRNWPIAASPVGQASFGGQWPVRPLTSCKLLVRRRNPVGTFLCKYVRSRAAVARSDLNELL